MNIKKYLRKRAEEDESLLTEADRLFIKKLIEADSTEDIEENTEEQQENNKDK